jgi:hypothetical protein
LTLDSQKEIFEKIRNLENSEKKNLILIERLITLKWNSMFQQKDSAIEEEYESKRKK